MGDVEMGVSAADLAFYEECGFRRPKFDVHSPGEDTAAVVEEDPLRCVSAEDLDYFEACGLRRPKYEVPVADGGDGGSGDGNVDGGGVANEEDREPDAGGGGVPEEDVRASAGAGAAVTATVAIAAADDDLFGDDLFGDDSVGDGDDLFGDGGFDGDAGYLPGDIRGAVGDLEKRQDNVQKMMLLAQEGVSAAGKIAEKTSMIAQSAVAKLDDHIKQCDRDVHASSDAMAQVENQFQAFADSTSTEMTQESEARTNMLSAVRDDFGHQLAVLSNNLRSLSTLHSSDMSSTRATMSRHNKHIEGLDTRINSASRTSSAAANVAHQNAKAITQYVRAPPPPPPPTETHDQDINVLQGQVAKIVHDLSIMHDDVKDSMTTADQEAARLQDFQKDVQLTFAAQKQQVDDLLAGVAECASERDAKVMRVLSGFDKRLEEMVASMRFIAARFGPGVADAGSPPCPAPATSHGIACPDAQVLMAVAESTTGPDMALMVEPVPSTPREKSQMSSAAQVFGPARAPVPVPAPPPPPVRPSARAATSSPFLTMVQVPVPPPPPMQDHVQDPAYGTVSDVPFSAADLPTTWDLALQPLTSDDYHKMAGL